MKVYPMKTIEELETELKIKFKNRELARQAFIHRSYLNEAKRQVFSNERLEFLGDSVLSFIVSEYLYKEYSNFPEGHLTNLRSTLVRTKMLATVAKELELGSLLLLSKGEEESGGRQNESILADTFESLIGVILLDQGLDKAKSFILGYLLPKLPRILKEKLYKDAKSTLQEKIQEEQKSSPVYKVIKEIGPDHNKIFTIGVIIGGKLTGEGIGKSKQEAEQEAARTALETLRKK